MNNNRKNNENSFTSKGKANWGVLGVNSKTHNTKERAVNDFYSTDPDSINYLLKFENFNNNIWEPACGDGVLSARLESLGFNVLSSDITYRGFKKTLIKDFLNEIKPFNGDIITNPPYNLSTEFVLKALELTKQKVAMFLKIQFVESFKRYEQIFKPFPPSRVYVFVKRIACYRNGEVEKYSSSAVCYAWYVWDKTYQGHTILEWIPNFKSEVEI